MINVEGFLRLMSSAGRKDFEKLFAVELQTKLLLKIRNFVV